MKAEVCKRCVLPESPPHIFLNGEGICNVCLEFDKQEKAAPLLESDFVKILDKHRGKHKYDCLVMCSGGKDSTAALYFMKERYGLNPLAFMFDHGFETKDAINNVKRAVNKLGVDFLFYKTNFMKDMFKSMIKSQSKAIMCHPCSIWYMDLAFEMAKKHDAPIIVAGWTKGQSNKQQVMSKCGCNIHNAEYKEMAKETQKFLDETLPSDGKYKDFPRTMEDLLKKVKKSKNKAMVLSPHWFLPYTPAEYVKIIKEKVGWEYPKLSYPERTTNCTMNFISVHNAMKYFGYTHYHVEISKLIREGVMTREEGLKDLDFKLSDELLESVLNKVDCTLSDIK